VEVVVRGKNIDVDDLMRDYVTKKLSKLDKFSINLSMQPLFSASFGDELKVKLP